MKALTIAPGDTVVVVELPIPEPGPNEIRVKVHSVALNLVDALYVAHPADKAFGCVVGSDIAGIVDKVGSDTIQWRVGDKVTGLLQGATSGNIRPGGFAQYVILEVDLAIRIPSTVSYDEAATLPLGSLTAAQALFIRLRINAPFPSPFSFPPEATPAPSILISSAATSIGFYAIELIKLLHSAGAQTYRVFATASPRNHAKLLSLGVEAVFEYRSPTQVDHVRNVSGGITHAFDCLSEDDTTAHISQTFREGGGTIAVIRKAAWNKDGIRADVTPLYGAAWSGLGHEILYNGETLPESPEWRAFTVTFFSFLGRDGKNLLIQPNPVRVMPGGLESIVTKGFALLGSRKVADREKNAVQSSSKPWMKPISGEKLIYHLTS
ncbi:GroES-like protein [Guyanagaster necrorhizus]|uniref:GroES-like protein n=1 Tax=Guyanagaster necrorhizus TaxID=856835 RepID=A0A9P7VI32_9AGAR|nr:GroES-like protein [Guyanagaster necrorhizus MCA 3950]KAG7440950.1 GroES-like protein [Guyanagaster necrorhizus MCA 3950]